MPLHLTNQLRRAIEDDPSRVVLFVGAGLSAAHVRSNGAGLPDWDTLMTRMIEDLRDADKGDGPYLKGLEDMVRQGKHLQVALAFRQRTRPDQFSAFLKHALDPADLCPSEIHQVILSAGFRGIITTNFDMVFEHQSNRLQSLVYPQFLDDIDSFRRPSFFAKIHGCIRNTGNVAENLILTEDGYAALRANAKYKTILRSLFVMHPVLTVGFSLRDPDFVGIVDDLRETLGDSTPTIYSLMYRPANDSREHWRQRGVEIVPYSEHGELLTFFKELLNLTPSKHAASKMPPPQDESRIDYSEFLDQWVKARTIEESVEIVARQIAVLPGEAQKESFLFQLMALMDRDDQICLAPHLLALSSKHARAAVLALFTAACKGEEREASSRVGKLKPHALHKNVHEWALRNWQEIASQSWRQDSEALFAWLLNAEWAQHGVEIWDTFLTLLNQVMAEARRNALCALYNAAEDLQGAQERIEKVVFEPRFIREDDSERPDHQRRWYRSWDEDIVRHVETARFEKSLNENGKKRGPADLIQLGFQKGHWRSVVKRLLTLYVHRTHLTLHSFSGEYHPQKADEIREALASVRDVQRQLEIFWEINHWPEEMRGLGSLGDDFESIREGLFIPLWWRFSSEARIKYLEGGGKRRMMSLLPEVGQEFLLERLMGLRYDPDQDFREAFRASAEEHRSDRREDGYNPNFLMSLWRGRVLTYDLSTNAPPELIRRIAMDRKSVEKFEEEIRWREAQRLAESALHDCRVDPFVRRGEKNYVIDNLLGAYLPEKVQIVLYTKMIDLAARNLEVEPDALGTVVYIHQTVHAFSHLGKDRDGRSWIDFGSPVPRPAERILSPAHEGMAQYYTYRLIEYVRDERLMKAFTVLEQNSEEIYSAWRVTQHFSLEQMRQALIGLRSRATDWPPKL